MREAKLLASLAGWLPRPFGKMGSFFIVGLIAATLGAGCHKSGSQNSGKEATTAELDGIVPTDPAIQANLDNLTGALRDYLHQHPMPKSFDEFVTGSGITPPPPPVGEKYKINPRWRVILVSADSK